MILSMCLSAYRTDRVLVRFYGKIELIEMVHHCFGIDLFVLYTDTLTFSDTTEIRSVHARRILRVLVPLFGGAH